MWCIPRGKQHNDVARSAFNEQQISRRGNELEQ